MIHPSEILRTNSDVASHFTAPVDTNRRNFDCGITGLPCLAEKLNLQRFATAKVFLAIFTILGMLEGALLSYFRGTSHIWTQHYYFSDISYTWLLHINEIFVGVFAVIITFWGDKIHRASWFGGLVMLHAVACIALVIPELYEPNVDHISNKTDINYLCVKSLNLVQSRETNFVALGVLITFQLFFAFATIVFYTLGITYLDDNIEKNNAPFYLVIPLATKISGRQLGLYLSWIPTLSNNLRIFTTAMWLVLSLLIFIFGFIIVLFPYSLPSMVVQRGVESLLNLASGNRSIDEDGNETSPKNTFLATFLRLIKNKILIINILAMVFMSTALINFELYQNIFYQSRFFVNVGHDLSGYSDPFLAQIIMNIIKYPFIATSLIATGLIIAKTQPNAKFLAIFNVSVYITAAFLYVSFIFSGCNDKIHSEFENIVTIPYCSSNCLCSNVPFAPVCTTEGNVTYFSPCHAGCQSSISIRDVQIYGNCTCGSDIFQQTNVEAVEGACKKDSCDLYWAFAQVSSVTASSILAATIITNLLINLRCVSDCDKPMALALETTLLGILPFIPGKLVYSLVAESMCKVRSDDDKCFYYRDSFTVFFSVTTVVLMSVAAILAFVIVFLIEDLNLYDAVGSKEESVTMDEMEELASMTDSTRQENYSNSLPHEERRLMNNDRDEEDDGFDIETDDESPTRNSEVNETNVIVHNEDKKKKNASDVLESDF